MNKREGEVTSDFLLIESNIMVSIVGLKVLGAINNILMGWLQLTIIKFNH